VADYQDLNNLASGTVYTRSYQDDSFESLTRTHYSKSGAETVEAMIANSGAVALSVLGAGGQVLPIQTVEIKKLDAGHRIHRERYRRRASSVNTSESQLLIDIAPAYMQLMWNGALTSGTLNNAVAPNSIDLESQSTSQWARDILYWRLIIPFEVTTTVLTIPVQDMVDHVNDNAFGIGGTTFAAYTLVFFAPRVRGFVVDGSLVYRGTYGYGYRREGWYEQHQQKNSTTFHRFLMHDAITFTIPPY